MFLCLIKLSYSCQTVFVLFCFFYGHTCCIWNFPGQGSNRNFSCRPMTEPQQRGIWAVSSSLHHSSWQCWILNPLNAARDWTHILTNTSRGHFRWAMTGTSECLYFGECPKLFRFVYFSILTLLCPFLKDASWRFYWHCVKWHNNLVENSILRRLYLKNIIANVY